MNGFPRDVVCRAGTFDTLLLRRRQTRQDDFWFFSCAALAAAADALVTLGFGLFQGDQSPPHAQIPAAHAAAQQLTIFLAFCVRSSYKRRGSLDYLLCKNASEVVAAAQSSEDKVA
jgi:hypothetical protein